METDNILDAREIECSEIREVISKTRERALIDLERSRAEVLGLDLHDSLVKRIREALSREQGPDGPLQERVASLIESAAADSARVRERVPVMLERVAVIESIEKYLTERLERHSSKKV